MSDLRKAAAPEPVAMFDERMGQPVLLPRAPMLKDGQFLYTSGVEHLRQENERLRGLLAEASKAVWMNYQNDLLDRIEAVLKEIPR